jgi:hypothetical protein
MTKSTWPAGTLPTKSIRVILLIWGVWNRLKDCLGAGLTFLDIPFKIGPRNQQDAVALEGPKPLALFVKVGHVCTGREGCLKQGECLRLFISGRGCFV